MSRYAILRTDKLKTAKAVSASLSHAFRERPTHNADPARTPDNENLVSGSVEQGMAVFKDRLPDKRRSDAVLAIEYFVGASPEQMQGMTKHQQDAYLKESLEWLKKRHGAENIISAVIHRDETTPHLSVLVVPIDKRGKLNAKEFLGGPPKMRQLQTDFADQVGKAHGFERGIEGSVAKHQRIQQYYANLEKTGIPVPEKPRIDPTPAVVKKGFLSVTHESPEMVQKRVEQAVNGLHSSAVDSVRVAADKAISFKFQAKRAEDELAKIPREIRSLHKDDMRTVERMASRLTAERAAAREAERQAKREQSKGQGWER